MSQQLDMQHWPRITFVSGDKIPQKLLEWRHKTFVEERHFLVPDELISENDQKGCHILLESADGSHVIGATHIMLAEESDFSRYSQLDTKILREGVYSSRSFVTPEARNRGYFSLLIYLALRWARMHCRQTYFGYMEEGEPPIRKMLAPIDLIHVPQRQIIGADNRSYQVVAGYGTVTQGIFRCYRTLSKNLKDFVNKTLIPDEIEHKIRTGIQEFYTNQWFEQVYSGQATRRQYAAVLTNLHHYVRWTTRLLARIIAETECPDLRTHYLDHLSGEINHERMLENDLEDLGFDADYWLNNTAPDPGILCFMAIQQSLAAFDRDPILFLIVPLVAEGLSAFISRDFIHALESCAQTWGVRHPHMITRFLRSHIHTDGGETGHWQAIRDILPHYINGEGSMQRALAIIDALLHSQRQTYDNIAKMIDPECKSAMQTMLVSTTTLEQCG